MQFRIQYLDGSANIIRELSADARSGMSAFELVADLPWAPRAVTMRVLDTDGRERHVHVERDFGRIGLLAGCRFVSRPAQYLREECRPGNQSDRERNSH